MGLPHIRCYKSQYKAQERGNNGQNGQQGNDVCYRSLGLIVIIAVEVGEVCIGISLPGKLWVEVLILFLQNQIVFVEALDGFHCVVFVQFIDVVGDAGVERGGGDRMDDGSVVGLLLVTVAVGVDE